MVNRLFLPKTKGKSGVDALKCFFLDYAFFSRLLPLTRVDEPIIQMIYA